MSIVILDNRHDGEAVRITAADWNGETFDGSPFSAFPEWLDTSLNNGDILLSEQGRDYACWKVKTTTGFVLAEADDFIAYEPGSGLKVWMRKSHVEHR